LKILIQYKQFQNRIRVAGFAKPGAFGAHPDSCESSYDFKAASNRQWPFLDVSAWLVELNRKRPSLFSRTIENFNGAFAHQKRQARTCDVFAWRNVVT
jgi:hypothetical protein